MSFLLGENMKKQILAVLLTCVIACACACTPPFHLERDFDLTEDTYLGRQAGTRGAKEAADAIAQELESFGYTAERQSFTGSGFLPETLRSALTLSMQNGQYSCVLAEEYQPAYIIARADVSGEITFDLRDADIARKIWVTDRLAPLGETSVKPAGILLKQSRPIKHVDWRDSNIPMFAVADSVYAQLASGEVKSVRMEIAAQQKECDLQNITATIPGRDSRFAFIVSAHYDGCGYDAGNIYKSAVDNASGVICMLKTAEYIAEKTRQTKPNIDIVFCAFDGEETGLQGSLAYAAAMTYQEVYCINIDCVEKGKNVQVQTNEDTKDLAAFLSAAISGSSVGELSGTSDNAVFSMLGHPAVLITTLTAQNDSVIHTAQDTPDQIDESRLAALGAEIGAYICSCIVREEAA